MKLALFSSTRAFKAELFSSLLRPLLAIFYCDYSSVFWWKKAAACDRTTFVCIRAKDSKAITSKNIIDNPGTRLSKRAIETRQRSNGPWSKRGRLRLTREEDEIYRRHFGDFKRSLFFARVVGIVLLSSASARASSASAPSSSFCSTRPDSSSINGWSSPSFVFVVVVPYELLLLLLLLYFSLDLCLPGVPLRTLVRLRRRRAAVAQTAAARAIIQLTKTTIIITSSSIPTRINLSVTLNIASSVIDNTAMKSKAPFP